MHHDFLFHLTQRSKILFQMEVFFQSKHFISLHTPIHSSSLIPEQHIAVYQMTSSSKEKHNRVHYLLPSPELQIKRLLSKIATHQDQNQDQNLDQDTKAIHVYEFSHSFRSNEQDDAIHNNEFIMLEWYQYAASLQDSLDICEALITHVIQALDITPSWSTSPTKVMSMEEAFHAYADIDLRRLIACMSGLEAARHGGLVNDDHDETRWSAYEWDDVFHYILVEKIEPRLKPLGKVYLTHYPSRIDTLAEVSQDSIWSERWELYIHGVEIANCYVEETSASRVREFIERQEAHIRLGGAIRSAEVLHDNEFLQKDTLPPYSGVALGFDRLVMSILSDKPHTLSSLRDVSPLSYLQ